MKKFTQMDQRQFLDELKFLNQHSLFEGTFTNAIKGILKLELYDEALEKRRISYNTALANLFRKYDLDCDNFYEQIDKEWKSIPSKSCWDCYKEQLNEPLNWKDCLIGNPLRIITPLAIYPRIHPCYAFYTYVSGLGRFWETYKDKAYQYAKLHSETKLKKNAA